jgi:hypothetical protein
MQLFAMFRSAQRITYRIVCLLDPSNDLLSRNAVRDERRCGSQAFVGSSMLLLCRAVILSTHHNRKITVKATGFRRTHIIPPFYAVLAV